MHALLLLLNLLLLNLLLPLLLHALLLLLLRLLALPLLLHALLLLILLLILLATTFLLRLTRFGPSRRGRLCLFFLLLFFLLFIVLRPLRGNLNTEYRNQEKKQDRNDHSSKRFHGARLQVDS